MMTNPEALRAIMQIQQGMSQLQNTAPGLLRCVCGEGGCEHVLINLHHVDHLNNLFVHPLKMVVVVLGAFRSSRLTQHCSSWE